MATNQPTQIPINELSHFDLLALEIINTFNLLIRQLENRKYSILKKLQDIKDEYISEKANRKDAIEELEITQQDIEKRRRNNQNEQIHKTINSQAYTTLSNI